MRTRLSCLAIVLVPLAVYATALLTDFGTPADFVFLDGAAGARTGSIHTTDGILNGALLDISYGFVHGVAELAYLRALSLLLLVLCGLALWQVLERSGWSELDAAAVSVCVLLLPTAQLAAGWASAWPVILAALLSIAGFAAVESELEVGGRRRLVAMLGGLLFYLAAAACYLPSGLMALVPLTGVGLARLPRLWPETRRWFLTHTALLVAGLAGAWGVERWMRHGAGLQEMSSLPQRFFDVVTYALPLSFAPFVAAGSPWSRAACTLAAFALLFALWRLIRRLDRVDPRVADLWRFLLPATVTLFAVMLLLLPGNASSYLAFWPMAGVAIVALLAAVRVLTTQPGGRPIWHHAVMGAVVACGAVAAFSQVQAAIVSPLAAQWSLVRETVQRTPFGSETRFEAVIAANGVSSPMPTGGFRPTLTQHKPAARGAVEAAIRERFPTGLPKGKGRTISATPPGSGAPLGAVVIDLTTVRQ